MLPKSFIFQAEGTPTPRITWRREDNKKIIIKRKKNAGKKGESMGTNKSLQYGTVCVQRTFWPPPLKVDLLSTQPGYEENIWYYK